jgi:hypothetical protein
MNLGRQPESMDILSCRASLPQGEYTVFVERIAAPSGVLDAPLKMKIDTPGAQGGELLVPGKAAEEKWQWVAAGQWKQERSGNIQLTLAPVNPEMKPEVIPVFGRVVFLRKFLVFNSSSPVFASDHLFVAAGQEKRVGLQPPSPATGIGVTASTLRGSGTSFAVLDNYLPR